MTGAERIAAERQRQIEAEGWTPEHDDQWVHGEMVTAAQCYLRFNERLAETDDVDRLMRYHAPGGIGLPRGWPWHRDWWKPSADPIRNLEKAGALIAAEIDKLLRQSEGTLDD